LLLTLLVGPVVGAHVRLDEQLIALSYVARQRLAHRAEGYEPQTGGNFTGSAAFILAGVVVTHETETGVTRIVFGDELRVASKIADRSQREAVQCDFSSGWWWCASRGQSRHLASEWNRDWLPVCTETRRSARVTAHVRRNLCMVGSRTMAAEQVHVTR
jgi:hypothetical protein